MIIADTDNHLIRKYHPKENKVVRIAGGDGGAFKLNQPHGVQLNAAGTLHIADSLNHRVLKLTAKTLNNGTPSGDQ